MSYVGKCPHGAPQNLYCDVCHDEWLATSEQSPLNRPKAPRPERLTEGQARGLAAILDLSQNGRAGEVVLINGYAGTGKTTLLGVVADEVGGVMVLAPTGKAAIRVQEATHQRAKTIHQWLYKPVVNPKNGAVEFLPKAWNELMVPASRVLVVDEGSMVSKEMWDDLMLAANALDLKVVVVMDEFQLPPIQKRDEPPFSLASTSVVKRARVDLTEVTRQALESPIIRASMELRAGRTIEALMNYDIPVESDLLAAAMRIHQEGGAIICHRNATRHLLNHKIRESKGLPADQLQADEPLLILKNNYGLYLFNGEVVRFVDWIRKPDAVRHGAYDFYSKRELPTQLGKAVLEGGFASYSDAPEATLAIEEVFGRAEGFSPTALAACARNVFGEGVNHLNCNLGYALTAHKAQGSEWTSALVVIENSINVHSHEGRRWLYTSMTRSKSNLAIHWAG